MKAGLAIGAEDGGSERFLYEAFAASLKPDLASLLIVSATNSPKPIIVPEHIKLEPCLICDIAVPQPVGVRGPRMPDIVWQAFTISRKKHSPDGGAAWI